MRLVTFCVCATWIFVTGSTLFAQDSQQPNSGSVESMLHAGMGQLGSLSHWNRSSLDHKESSDAESVAYLLQKSADGKLYLTPNQSFFPRLGLQAAGLSEIPDRLNLNGGKSFAWIEGWNKGESAQWAWWCEQLATVRFRVFMKSGEAPCRFQMRLGEDVFPFTIPPLSSAGTEVFHGEWNPSSLGKQDLEITCLDNQSGSHLLWIELSGGGVKDASVIRKRWRPSAAHTRFSSSMATRPIRVWVMEMDAVPGTLGFYSPITTPFGYYGPTWLPDGRVNTGFNFSLWSYGRGKKSPPIEQLSHLLAIGDENASFGHFGHEGTGVKIRDWEPLKGLQQQSQVFALRVESGETYNTYYSYFYHSKENSWKLFGIGNQYNKGKPLESLWVGSFVEVPGPPQVQRSGVYPRRMRYRGWVLDDQGEWFRLDQMSNGNIDRESGLTHTKRGVTEAGWFYLETGGWGYQRPSEEAMVVVPDAFRLEKPVYLKVESVRMLEHHSNPVSLLSASRRGNDLVLNLESKELGGDTRLDLFYGLKEGLTFAERWDKVMTLARPMDSEQDLRVSEFFSGYGQGQRVYLRLRLIGEEGQYWNSTTWAWDPDLNQMKSR